MLELKVHIVGLDQLRANFNKAPALTLKYLAKATAAAIFEVEKEAQDRNFQFKTPRSLRTGQLQLSFKHGRYISSDGLRGSIGPTVRYAPYVYFGTTRGLRPNKYMDRIAAAAQPGVQKQFQAAVTKVVAETAKL